MIIRVFINWFITVFFVYFAYVYRSAKTLTKRPVSSIPRPESFDKATSTSDPLLEDDAVQVQSYMYNL